MSDSIRANPLSAFQERFRELEAALEGATTRGDAAPLKHHIVELFQQLEEVERGLHELKEGLRGLARRYRSFTSKTGTPAPGLAPAAPVRSAGLNSSTFKEKAWNAIAVEDYEGAMALLERALELAPDDLGALSSLGWAQMMRGDHDDALLTYQRVLTADPDDALARVNLGYICLQKGIFGEAIEHLSKAIRSGRDRKAVLYAHYYLGLVYVARQMYGDAESFLERAIELGPAMSEAHYQLGRARYLGGRREAAVAAWQQGAAANPYGPWGKRCADAVAAAEEGKPPALDGA